MSLSQMSQNALDIAGQEVVHIPETSEPENLTAVVADFGFQPAPPSGWDAGLFQGQGRYASFRLHPDHAAPVEGDVIVWDGDEFDVRQIFPEPSTGPQWLWAVVRGVARQGGGV